jgi:hypothetical protein
MPHLVAHLNLPAATPYHPLPPQVKLLNLSGWVMSGGRRGDNVVRQMGEGITVGVRRTLLAVPGPPPPMAVAVRMSVLVASLLDTEYHTILGVLSGNFGEQLDLPPDIFALHTRLLAEQRAAAAAAAVAAGGAAAVVATREAEEGAAARSAAEAAASGGNANVPANRRLALMREKVDANAEEELTGSEDEAPAEGGPLAAGTGPSFDSLAEGEGAVGAFTNSAGRRSRPRDPDSSSSGKRRSGGGGAAAAAAAGGDAEEPSGPAEAKRRAVVNFGFANAALLALLEDAVAMTATVSIGSAQLMLWSEQPDGQALPLGSVEFGNFWLSWSGTARQNMLLSVAMPTVCARDLRPGVPKEASLVLSTAAIGGGGHSAHGMLALAAPPPTMAAAVADGGAAVVPAAAGAPGRASEELLPSLLRIEMRAVTSIEGAGMVTGIQLRLQRPTLVLDIGFIMQVRLLGCLVVGGIHLLHSTSAPGLLSPLTPPKQRSSTLSSPPSAPPAPPRAPTSPERSS